MGDNDNNRANGTGSAAPTAELGGLSEDGQVEAGPAGGEEAPPPKLSVLVQQRVAGGGEGDADAGREDAAANASAPVIDERAGVLTRGGR